MKKYSVEFLGTFLFITSIIGILWGTSSTVPLYIGTALATLVYMGGPLSGAHYNPAVTFGIWFNQKISSDDAIKYVMAQLLAAILAYWLARYWLGISLGELSLTNNLISIFVAEFLFTFALVSVIYHVAINKATAGNSYFGIAIGAIVMTWAASVGSISGGFFNPAVLLGIGLFGMSIKAALIILVAQILWATGAAYAYRYIVGK